MKVFTNKILVYLLTVVVVLFLLEIIYTNAFYNPINPRSKTSWMMSLDSKDTLDYALFGSSRCIHSVNPTIINNRIGTNGLNLAYQASNPLEVKLSFKTLLKRKHVKRIFVQVDYSYNQLKPHPLAEIAWMPFLKEDYVYDEFKDYDNKYWYLKNIPFYRYMKYDSKIGFRDLLFNYTKKSNIIDNYGYVPLTNTLKIDEPNNSSVKALENPHIKEVIDICEKANIKVDFFTAPIYRFQGDYTALKTYLPNYTNFSKVLDDISSFQDNTHINDKGAEAFTELFMNHYFSE